MIFKDKIEKAEEIINTYINKYPNCGVALSFGKDSMVLMHIVRKIKPDIFSFAVLSNTEFPETIILKNRIIKDWKLNYKEYVFKNKINGSIADCCRTQKVKTFKKAVKKLDMWFSGIRKDEGITRTNFEHVEEKGGLTKVNPILDFNEKDIWRYTAVFSIPVNPLYGEGYRSLSCSRCSVVEKDENESERAGRWAGTINQGAECGIHTQSLRDIL